MELEKTPGLTDAERDTIFAYQEAHMEHAAAAMGTLFDPAGTGEQAEALTRALARIEEAHARLVELAPAGTPGREGGPGYGELLGLLRDLGLGGRDIVRPEDPPVPWQDLPEARLLAFCCLDLMHYAFLTGGAQDLVPGRASKERLYDVPSEARGEKSEEEIAGAHGDRHELQMRLWRLLERAIDDTLEGRREKLRGAGYDCGYDLRLFISRYGDDPEYVEGFVEGCLERIREEEEEGLMHPDDVTAEQLERSWREPGFTREEKRELVLEPLLAECEVREDEGDLWRL